MGLDFPVSTKKRGDEFVTELGKLFSVTNLLLGIQIFPTLNFAISTDLSAKPKENCRTVPFTWNSRINTGAV